MTNTRLKVLGLAESNEQVAIDKKAEMQENGIVVCHSCPRQF